MHMKKLFTTFLFLITLGVAVAQDTTGIARAAARASMDHFGALRRFILVCLRSGIGPFMNIVWDNASVTCD